jgi:hypothetical protein
MKFLGAAIVAMSCGADLLYTLKSKVAASIAARIPQHWTTVRQLEEYLRNQKGEK